MSAEIVRGALWANDLRWLPTSPRTCCSYDLFEVEDGWPIGRLATAMDIELTAVRDRLERGCRAFVAGLGSEVAGWLWVSTDRESAPLLRRDLHFEADECYGWGAATLPLHRGHGLFTALLRFAGWWLAREGRRLMWGGILDENLASQRSCAGAGMRPVLRLVAAHEPARLRTRRVEYADPLLVRRARRVLGPATRSGR